MTDELRNRIATIASGFIPLVGRSTIDLANAIMPEIDRRVAEERAKLLEGLADYLEGYAGGHHMAQSCAQVVRTWPELLAQFEKENSHEQG